VAAVNRILKAGGKVARTLSEATVGAKRFKAGSFVVDAGSISNSTLAKISDETGATAQGGKVPAQLKTLVSVRVALYQSWTASMDAGWISYIFDRYEIPFHSLTDAEIRAGDLEARFDVIVLPDQNASSIINGHRKGTMPPEYVGGIKQIGIDNLRAFVAAGGTLVCNKSSSEFAINEFNLPIKNALKDVRSDTFNCPGSLIKVMYESDHPLTFGLEEKGVAYFSRGLAFELITDTEDKAQDEKNRKLIHTIARYPDEGLLLSGWILGEELIRGKSAILEVTHGDGRIILFGFNFHNRAQSYANFKLLFNALLF
jgi:hypothetical protein